MSGPARTVVSRVIHAPRSAVYRAYLDPDALAAWLPPGSMTGIVHAFEPHDGGAFSMSLIYPDGDSTARGKTSDTTDTFRGRFVRLVPDEQIVWAVEFESADPAFAGEMTVRTDLERAGAATRVTVTCDNIPPGVRLADNEEGCRLTLEQLAAYLGG